MCTTLAGVAYDNLGPMLTAYCGEFMQLLGFLCLAFSSQSAPLYIPSALLLAISANLVAFPTLVIADMFPRHRALMTGMTVSMQLASGAIPIALRAVFPHVRSFKWLMLGYTLIFVLPTLLIFPLSLPYDRMDAVAANPLEKRASKKDLEDEGTASEVLEGEKLVSGILTLQVTTPRSRRSSVELQEPERSGPNTAAASRLGSFIERSRRLSELSMSTYQAISGIRGLDARTPSMHFQVEEIAEEDSGTGTNWRHLRGELLSQEWLLFTLFYSIQILIFAYYPTAVRHLFGDNVANMFGYFFPAEAIIGALVGIPVQLSGTVLPTVFVLSLLVCIVFGLALTHITALHYFGVCLYVIGESYVYASKFTYFQEVFPPRNFGVLVGLTGSLSGVSAFLNIAIINSHQWTLGVIILLAIGLLDSTIILYLMFLKFYKKRSGKIPVV